jgi:hypothetical protein
MDENIVAAIAVIMIFGLPAVGWIISLMYRHEERMEMLRRGIVPPPIFDKNAYKAWKRSGAAWPPPGTGTAQQAPWAQQPVPPPRFATPDDDPQRALYKGVRVALIGLAITIGLGWAFGGYRGNPAILGGLIPMFVGIAQILVAVLSGAQLPGVMPQTTFIPPPQPPPGPGAPPPPPGTGFAGNGPPPPWAQQPGRPRFEELSKPVPPPEIK